MASPAYFVRKAWSSLGALSKLEAKERYISFVQSRLGAYLPPVLRVKGNMPRKRESKETMTDVSPEKPSPSTTDPNPRPAPTSPQNTISASPKSSPTTSPVNSLPPSPVPHVSPASPGTKINFNVNFYSPKAKKRSRLKERQR